MVQFFIYHYMLHNYRFHTTVITVNMLMGLWNTALRLGQYLIVVTVFIRIVYIVQLIY